MSTIRIFPIISTGGQKERWRKQLKFSSIANYHDLQRTYYMYHLMYYEDLVNVVDQVIMLPPFPLIFYHVAVEIRFD